MDSLCGNKDKYTEIKNWLDDFYKNYKSTISINSCIFVSGISGIGKTYSINKICEILNLYVIKIDNSNCDSSDKLIDIINKSKTQSIYQIFTNNNLSKVIIIDELDTILSIDRTISITLLNILSKEKIKNIPIICICSPEILKKIGDIKKKCKIYELSPPTDKEIYNTIRPSFKNYKADKLKKIIKICDGNISQFYKQILNTKNKPEENHIIDKIYEVENLYSPVVLSRDNIKNIILIDPWLIPLRFHENLIIDLNTNKKGSKKQKCDFYSKFMLQLCDFDRMMYNNIIENAIDYFVSIILYDFNKLESRKNVELSMKNFTKILSYLSLQKKYIKQSYTNIFPLYQISNYHTNSINRNFIYFN